MTASGPEHISAPTGRVMRQIVRQRLATKVHELGPRPMLELLQEVESGVDLDRALERYATGDPATFRALGADTFPRIPIRSVS